jgi:hypothetical protein
MTRSRRMVRCDWPRAANSDARGICSYPLVGAATYLIFSAAAFRRIAFVSPGRLNYLLADARFIPERFSNDPVMACLLAVGGLLILAQSCRLCVPSCCRNWLKLILRANHSGVCRADFADRLVRVLCKTASWVSAEEGERLLLA